MAVSDTDRQAAESWMQQETARHPIAVAARYNRRMDRIVVALDNGVELMFRPALAQGLEHATADDLATIEISPSGMGLHWPSLDADLYVPGLLAGALGSKRWMEVRQTATEKLVRGGATTAGSRTIGRASGRPRKTTVI